jgi:hypothetical protein
MYIGILLTGLGALGTSPAVLQGRAQSNPANSPPRECQHDDEHLREDSEYRRGEGDEDPGNDVCNYCATGEARKFANYVEVFLAGSLQVSTLDRVREIWRRGGIATVVVEREVRVVERWYASCFQCRFSIRRNRQRLCGF